MHSCVRHGLPETLPSLYSRDGEWPLDDPLLRGDIVGVQLKGTVCGFQDIATMVVT